ncbi:hypothetical protein MPDQ_008115 [Monascus purpureus]|uniref:Nitric oxide synthase-interacting protein zinc-finger domain-containing protein n=1 Tax=Monascus purpureus TaxID=5098 RepID=A0A507QUN9_MONPU|nr:hypothetical protein MPDQ_008115 [Monascus purpureus]
MAHSKRNTSLPHFTSYERSLLRGSWGTQRTRIGRDSFLPFDSCRLCLQPARAPVVACATNGDLFCRECAISDLLAQRQEIKRLEREREEARRRLEEEEARTMEEAKAREVREFELVSMGLEGSKNNNNRAREEYDYSRKRKVEEAATTGSGGVDVEGGKRRRLSSLDEKGISPEERENIRRELKREKSDAKSSIHSFWIPSLTPDTDPTEAIANKSVKLSPICPGSNESNRHSYSLKSLVDVHFTEDKATDGSFMTPSPDHQQPDPHASKEEQERSAAMQGRMLCYVCETDITPDDWKKDTTGATDGNGLGNDKKSKRKRDKDKDKNGVKPGLVEVSSEGTGFAGKGGNVATKVGVAFQC